MRIEPAAALVGHLAVPGDKSISHRAVLLGAIGEGETRIEGLGRSEDTEATIRAVRALGVRVDDADEDTLVVHGAGLRGLRPPRAPIDCANSGTSMRLLAGVLAGQEGRFELVGDESLSSRPMERVAEPLRQMGAEVETTDGHAPLVVSGRVGGLNPVMYRLPMASAQVKSAVLLAGLYADGETTVVEPAPTRDHTELLLEAAGARVKRRAHSVSVQGMSGGLTPGHVRVPGDFSSAAPFLVAATLLAGSELTVHGVGLNPRRTGLLDVLERMGGRVGVLHRTKLGAEPAGDLEVRSAPLVSAEVVGEEVPLMVDELPLFALLAVSARGRSRLLGAEELRAKESDRIEAMVGGLRRLGAHIRETEDGFVATGVPARLRGGSMSARGDHRIAMLGALAGLHSVEGVEVEGAESVSVSFPGFFDLLERLRT